MQKHMQKHINADILDIYGESTFGSSAFGTNITQAPIITAMSIEVSAGPYIQPSTITVTITWQNIGNAQGSFDPAILIDGIHTVIGTVLLDPGLTYTQIFIISNLMKGIYIICPDPN